MPSIEKKSILNDVDPNNVNIDINTTEEYELPVILIKFNEKSYYFRKIMWTSLLGEIRIKPLIIINE